MARAPNAALHSVKRFLGQSLEEAQKELNMLPFEVEEKDGKVFFKVSALFTHARATLLVVTYLRGCAHRCPSKTRRPRSAPKRWRR